MRRPAATMHRKGKRMVPHIILLLTGVIVLTVGILALRSWTRPSPYRQVLVILGNPVHIVSWSADRKRVAVLDIPPDVTVESTRGFGRYGVGPLFTLDGINDLKGALFIGSLSYTLGLPVSWYVAPPARIADGAGGVELLRRVFSWTSIFHSATARGDMPFSRWVAFVFAAQSLSGDAVQVTDVSGAYVPITMPDGSLVREVDISRLDYLLGTSFLDTGIRGEGTTVAVYNTTDVPSVGQHAARVMGKMGMPLVFVGNAQPARDTCLLTGSKDALSTRTAAFIRDYFTCAESTSGQPDNAAAADLVVLLGKKYAAQFLPQ